MIIEPVSIKAKHSTLPKIATASLVSHIQRLMRLLSLQFVANMPIKPLDLLFILCVETLAIYIRERKNIQGIRLTNNEIKITQFADDTCLYLNGTNSLENVLKVFEDFL